MIYEDEEETTSFVMLHDSDFPEYYVNKCHPEDYVLNTTPNTEIIFHERLHHSRLLLRICFEVEGGSFLPLTFVCDTGIVGDFYLCEKTMRLLSSRIKTHPDLLVKYIKVLGKKMVINSNHSNVNILGLKSLMSFGLQLKIDGFEFTNLPEFF